MCPEGAEAGDDVMACGSRERQLFVVATNKTVKGKDLWISRQGEGAKPQGLGKGKRYRY